LYPRRPDFDSIFLSKEIRRFSIPVADYSFGKLKEELTRIAHLNERELKIESLCYEDLEGDMIMCESEEEFKEALKCYRKSTFVIFVDLSDMKK
jgi:hypothetical protein